MRFSSNREDVRNLVGYHGDGRWYIDEDFKDLLKELIKEAVQEALDGQTKP